MTECPRCHQAIQIDELPDSDYSKIELSCGCRIRAESVREIEHVLEYQLAFNLGLSELQRAKGYRRMERYGRWKEEMWWHPGSAVGYDEAAKRAGREGFHILDRRVTED
jgi:hypothetical protein